MRELTIERDAWRRAMMPLGCLGLGVVLALMWGNGANAATVVGVNFDPFTTANPAVSNGTTQVSIVMGGYTTPYGLGLYSGGSDDWPAGTSPSLGTYIQVPSFQPEYDPNNARLGNTGSSITLGADSRVAGLTNTRDVVFTRWADGFGLVNEVGLDLAIFEKGTSEAYAIRAHNATTGTWTPWYYEIFKQTTSNQFTTATEYDLSDLGVGLGNTINGIQITNLTDVDTVATSTTEFDAGVELGYGEVIFGGGSGFAPARRRSEPNNELKQYEAGKYDPDIQFVVALHDITTLGVPDTVSLASTIPTPIPTALYLMLPALGMLFARGRTRGTTHESG